MKTLGGSYLKFFMCKQRDKERAVWCSREIAPTRQENGFLEHQKGVRDGFSLAVSFQRKYIHPVTAASAAQTNVESEEIQAMYSDHPKTIHVRFKLHKECTFGEQFLIVGDDPIVGLWNLSDGVPLNWSDGHLWTVEMDIPSGKMIKYKFILKGKIGDISWQPGPDRILETWDTDKTITVFEDWDNPELQHIVEEELVADLNEESLIDSDLLMVAENLNQPHKEGPVNSDLLAVDENLDQPILDEGTDVIEEVLANVNGNTNHAEKPSALIVAENITEELGEQDLSFSDKGSGLMSVTDQKKEEMISENDSRMVNGSNLLSSEDETRLVEDEGVRVLVPGLIPVPLEEMEAAELNQVESNSVENTTIGSDEIEGSTKPELEDEHVSASLHSSTKTSEMMNIDEKRETCGAEHMENNILESDMQWGRRTLQKFLANFGFPVTL